MAQGQTVVISQWYWVFIAQNRIHIKTRKNPGFPGFLFSATRNPGFKIVPRIGNTNCDPQAIQEYKYSDLYSDLAL